LSAERDRTFVREFAFEMRLCARLESEGHLVARQLGAGDSRVMDAVVVDPGPSFDDRARITAGTISHRVVESDLGPGRACRLRDVDLAGEYDREAVDTALEQGFLQRERRGSVERVRQATRYPHDWFGGLVGIENKPDLETPGDLELQVRKDVSLGLFDRVIVCTASHVTGAHLNRLPDAVGVWRFFPERDAYEVVREADPLPVAEPGIAVLEEGAAKVDIRPVDAAEKARYRRRMAERAYGKGWRVALPDCPHVEEREVAGVGGLPFCTRKERIAHPTDPCECGCEGGPPDLDLEERRAATSPWVRDPPGVASRQVGLDRFE
jgi:hypothetical protein